MEIGGNDIDDEQRDFVGCEVLKHAAVKIKSDDDELKQVKGRDRLPPLPAPAPAFRAKGEGAWRQRRE